MAESDMVGDIYRKSAAMEAYSDTSGGESDPIDFAVAPGIFFGGSDGRDRMRRSVLAVADMQGKSRREGAGTLRRTG